MRCQRCGKSIGALRELLVDREFCCAEHRRRGPLASASALRDLEDQADPMWGGGAAGHSTPQAQKSSGASLAPFVLVTVGLMLGARIWFPEDGSPAGTPLAALPQTGAETQDSPTPYGLLEWLDDLLPGPSPLRLQMIPSDRLDAWTPVLGKSSRRLQWRVERGMIYPGALRLWGPTLASTDYDFTFSGLIERRALSWAWRARDSTAYYSAKIRLPGPKGGPAALERIVVEGGRVLRREEFPLPVPIEKSKSCEITVAVRGASFRTLLDGQMIDHWTDARLRSGGVGFYAEEGESAAILWARFRERTSLLERLNLAILLAPPGATL